MAISQRAAGSWAASNATTQTVTIPVGSTAGDMMVMHFARKPFSGTTPTVNQGWTVVGTHADGSVANGDGVGSVLGGIAYKIHTGSESNPTITWGTTAAPGIAVIVTFQKGAGETWDTPVSIFGNVNNSTSINVTLGSDPGVTAGDMAIAGFYTRDNSTITTPQLTQTGITYGTRTEFPATAIATTTSNDMAGDSVYRIASSGTSSAAPVLTASQSAAETGVLSFTRLRVSTSTNASAGLASATATVVPLGAYSVGTIADSDVLAYWRLGESSGTNANDEIGTADGTYVNTPTLGAASLLDSEIDTAVTFALASTEHVSIATGIPAGSSSGATIECWLRMTSLASATIHSLLRWGAQSTSVGYHWLFFDNRTTPALRWQFADGSLEEFSQNWTPVVGQRYHIAVSHDYAAETVAFYVDGVRLSLTSTAAAAAPISVAANAPSFIASFTSTLHPIDATLDEVALYDAAKTTDWALSRYLLGVGQTLRASLGGVAGAPASTGAANNASVNKVEGIGHASATGAAYDVSSSTLVVSAPTEAILGQLQLGTASLADTIISGAAATATAATGAANQPSVALTANAEHIAATGAAGAGAVNKVDGIQTVDAITGSAFDAGPILVVCFSTAGSVTATAHDVASITVRVFAEHASATAAAGNVILGAGAQAIPATGEVHQALAALTANAEHVSVAGTSNQPSVNTSTATNANAGHASATLATSDVLVGLGALSESAAATAAAWGATLDFEVLPEAATAFGSAYDVDAGTQEIEPQAGQVSVTGTAYDPVVVISMVAATRIRGSATPRTLSGRAGPGSLSGTAG